MKDWLENSNDRPSLQGDTIAKEMSPSRGGGIKFFHFQGSVFEEVEFDNLSSIVELRNNEQEVILSA